MQSVSPQNDYRPEIDFLRAVAVTLVVVFHCFPNAIPGGFIGVDVFFVISGYLITSHLMTGFKDNSFSFAKFYQRRALRLLPALYLIVLVTAVLSFIFLTPKQYHLFSESAIHSLFYLANHFFAYQSGYFGPAAEELPLLHTWSLSVEEQFYLIWPLLLLLSYRYFSKVTLWWWVFALTLTSLAFAQSEIIKGNSDSYFLLPYRAVELLIGALIALKGTSTFSKGKVLGTTLFSLGILLIVGSSFMLNSASLFPGLNALWACLGAALVIIFGGQVARPLMAIISSVPVLSVGLWSYSIYLWHWPILVFGHKLGLLGSGVSYVFALLLLLLISYLTWRFVEQAFRSAAFPSPKTFFVRTLLPSTLCLGLLISLPFELKWQQEAWYIIWGDEVKHVYLQANNREKFVAKRCNQSPKNPHQEVNISDCQIGSIHENSKADFLLIGDSHARHFIGFFDDFGITNQLMGVVSTRAVCPTLLGVSVLQAHGIYEACDQRNANTLLKQINEGYDYVIIAARWNSYSGGNTFPGYIDESYLLQSKNVNEREQNRLVLFELGLQNLIEKVIRSGSIPVLVDQVPEFPFIAPKCVIAKRMGVSKDTCLVDRKQLESKHRAYSQIFSLFEKKYSELIRLNMFDALCDEQVCSPVVAGNLLYRDSNHLSPFGSKVLYRSMEEKVIASLLLKQEGHVALMD